MKKCFGFHDVWELQKLLEECFRSPDDTKLIFSILHLTNANSDLLIAYQAAIPE